MFGRRGSQVSRKQGCAAAAALTCGLALLASPAQAAKDCEQPIAADGNEAPCNPHLAGNVWSESHRNSYAQGSSPYLGPEPGDEVTYEHTGGILGGAVILNITDPYPDGGRAIWFSVVATPDGENVYKVDYDSGEIIDSLGKQDEADTSDLTIGSISASGAYSILDAKNRLIVGRRGGLDVYRDAVAGDRFSDVARIKRFLFPQRAFCGANDRVVGAAMLWDGTVAFATEFGNIGTVPKSPSKMTAKNVRVLSVNGERCAGATLEDESLDIVSNSIAADENGGIYMVTSQGMYKFRWDGKSLKQVWRGSYEVGAGASGVRLGPGSGSTPSLMGTADGDDRFVVFTDGQDLMHLVLMWRGKVPGDWKGLPGKDRRIACEVPVTFGDPSATESLSEQSVMVRGYSAVVVNNKLQNEDELESVPPGLRPAAAALAGQDPENAPYGLERFDWNPSKRSCASRWVNEEVSIPNAIPSMSAATGLVYGIGQRDGVWGLEGVDFETGESVLRVDGTADSTENSAFAATSVGPDGTIFSGTFLGYSIFRPAKPKPPPKFLDAADLRGCAPRNPRPLLGTGAGETLLGGGSVDAIFGRGGGDTLVGRRGGDCLYGAAGIDLLLGKRGADVMFGGADRDTLKGNAGDDEASGGGAPDRIRGGGGNDVLRGNGGEDTINGGTGDDRLNGARQDDRLRGGPGDDILRGGQGNDILRGGGGSDTFNCGDGRDKAIVSGTAAKLRGCERVVRRRS